MGLCPGREALLLLWCKWSQASRGFSLSPYLSSVQISIAPWQEKITQTRAGYDETRRQINLGLSVTTEEKWTDNGQQNDRRKDWVDSPTANKKHPRTTQAAARQLAVHSGHAKLQSLRLCRQFLIQSLQPLCIVVKWEKQNCSNIHTPVSGWEQLNNGTEVNNPNPDGRHTLSESRSFYASVFAENTNAQKGKIHTKYVNAPK